MKQAELGSIFKLGKYMLRMRFESLFMRMISNFKYKFPPPRIYVAVSALLDVPGLSHICIVAGYGVYGVSGLNIFYARFRPGPLVFEVGYHRRKKKKKKKKKK